MARSAAEAVRKTRLAVKCKSIVETDIVFDKTDKFLESGSFGKVRHGHWNSLEVAVKYFSSAEEKKGYKDELVFLSKLQTHNHIVVLHGTGLSKTSNQPFIVLEFAPYSLEHVLHRSYPYYCYDAHHVMHWVRQLAAGLEYIHQKRILHRDIKASNVLLFDNGCHLKLCDFGTCRKLESNLLYTASIGTVRYMAPEVIQGEQYTAKCDVFSLAITFWEMLARQVPTVEPNAQLNSYAILYKMVQGRRPPLLGGVPRFVVELLTRCWHQNPQRRMTSSEIHQKLSSICKVFDYGAPLRILEGGGPEEQEKCLSERTTSTNTYDLTNESLLSVSSEPEETSERHQVVGLSVLADCHVSERPDLPFGDGEGKSAVLVSPGGGQYAVINHDVNEFSEPNSDDTRYASLDENRMRLDVQRQFHHITQGYSSGSVTVVHSSTYSAPVRSKRVQPTKATTDSPYSISSLPADMQPVLPVEEDTESLRLWQQYKQLTEHVQASQSYSIDS